MPAPSVPSLPCGTSTPGGAVLNWGIPRGKGGLGPREAGATRAMGEIERCDRLGECRGVILSGNACQEEIWLLFCAFLSVCEPELAWI